MRSAAHASTPDTRYGWGLVNASLAFNYTPVYGECMPAPDI